jgi:hypothetical protein
MCFNGSVFDAVMIAIPNTEYERVFGFFWVKVPTPKNLHQNGILGLNDDTP